MKHLLKFSLLLAIILLTGLSCKKENTKPDTPPEEEIRDNAHFFDPNAENVTVQFMGQTISCQKINGKLVFQGDIVIVPDEEGTRAAEWYGTDLWEEGKIFFKIDEKIDKKDYRDAVEEAMKHISSNTNIKFVELKTIEAKKYREGKSYINFITGDGNCSQVGVVGSGQELSIKNKVSGIVIHELGHALGLMHEHSRFDRDDYLKLIEENIDEKYKEEDGEWEFWIRFNILKTIEIGKHYSEFEYGSIMMYEPSAGIGKPYYVGGYLGGFLEVMKKKDGTSYKKEYQRDHLSEGDKKVLKEMYPKTDVSPDITMSESASIMLSDGTFKAVAELIYAGSPVINNKGFSYKIQGATSSTEIAVSGTNTGQFSLILSNFEPNRTYEVRAYVLQGNKKNYSENFVTFVSVPGEIPVSFTISNPKDLTHNSVTFDASVTTTATVSEKGICYSLNNPPLVTDPKEPKGAGAGNFTATLTKNLTAETQYYARPYAIVNGTAYYGEVKPFKTTGAPVNITFTISNPKDLTHNSVTFDASVTTTGTVSEKGICYSLNNPPLITDPKEPKGAGAGNFTATLTKTLTAETQYYARPYAIVNGIAYYGEVKPFKTLKAPGGNDEWVEINGVKWATRNLAAHGVFCAKPEEYGALFQWGRKGDGHEKRTSETAYGTIFSLDANGQVPVGNDAFGKFIIGYLNFYDWRSPQDDKLWNSGTESNPVKTANDPCPQGWRIPTDTELSVLKQSNVTRERIEKNGICGYQLTGYEGSFFLPSAGYRYLFDGSLDHIGSYGHYWTSSTYDGYVTTLIFRSDYDVFTYGSDSRASGLSVRCVKE